MINRFLGTGQGEEEERKEREEGTETKQRKDIEADKIDQKERVQGKIARQDGRAPPRLCVRSI